MGGHNKGTRAAAKFNTSTFPLLEPVMSLGCIHTPSIAFLKTKTHKKHTQQTARFGYATEGALDLYLRAAVHGRCQRAPKGLDTANKTVEATWRLSTHLNITRPPWVGNKSSVSIQTMFGFICATSINVGGR